MQLGKSQHTPSRRFSAHNSKAHGVYTLPDLKAFPTYAADVVHHFLQLPTHWGPYNHDHKTHAHQHQLSDGTPSAECHASLHKSNHVLD